MARSRPPFWLVLAAAAYLGYFALLVYCHGHRPLDEEPRTVVSRGSFVAANLMRPLGGLSFDPGRDAVLYGIRTVQLITLLLALKVAFRRPRDPIALSGAWLLATAGVFSVALPAGWATAWRLLPAPAAALLWFPFLSTLAGGSILFIFAAQFTRNRRALSAPVMAAIAIGMAVPVLARGVARMSLVYGWDAPFGERDFSLLIVLLNGLPAVAALAVLFRHYNATPSLVERRRARLVLTGGSIGLLAGVAVMVAADVAGPQPGRSLFASTSLTAGTLLFLLFPLSFAYAILRYRLFGLGGAIRLGLRYAVARRALLSLVPLAAAALVFDIWSQGDRPLREILSARAGVYMMLAGGAIAAHLTRDRWLEHLDRTFFRERYDARRLLIDLVAELRGGRPFEELSSVAVSAIERALHPTDVTIAVRGAKGFASWESSELVVPVTTPDGDIRAVIRLGPKKSEEPYSGEDRELLAAIADSLALAPPVAQTPDAGPLQNVPLPHVIAGRYRLERVIGRGGMGVVYEAVDLTLDRRVALKLIRDELLGSESAVRRFEMEARAAAGFSHPNVIVVHDFDAGGGTCAMIVMELLSGRTLRPELTGQPLPPARVAAVIGPVAAAIDAAHARRLLHRDLKPENIFLVHDGGGERVKVLDFGIARPLDTSSGMTADGALLGTPRYMAPEQLRGEEPSTAWDIWALAVIAFEMLTGAHPFGGARPSTPLSPPLEAFFTRAFDADPQRRPRTAGELKAQLDEAIHASAV